MERESLIGSRIGSLYVTSQIDNKVYCYCSNCGNYNVELSYTKAKDFTDEDKIITCGCNIAIQSTVIENLIGIKYNELTVVKQIDSKTIECRCICGKVFSCDIDKLKNNSLTMCEECMKKKEKLDIQILDDRNKKELKYIWYKYKELYKNPTKKFKREIIDNGIKFFPELEDNKQAFEFFCQWANIKKYGEYTSKCYLDRKNYLEDYNSENCFWASLRPNDYVKFSDVNEDRKISYIETTRKTYTY